MSVIKVDGFEMPGPRLIDCILLALDLSSARAGEIEVFHRGVKVGGFLEGKRIFPPERIPTSGTLAEVESRAIQRAMELSNGSVADAAELLGIAKGTLYRRIRPDETVRSACTA